MLKEHPEVEVIAEARNGQEAIASVANHNPDLVFLDVQMPDLDGFDVLRNLNAEQLPVIIFVTAYDQYALRAFDVHAVDYLTKPFDRERFVQAVEQAKIFMKGAKEPDTERILNMLQELRAGTRYLERFAVKNGETLFSGRAEDVEAIEAQGNYVRLSLAGTSHLVRDTLNNFESQIKTRRFVRIHRRTIVNN